MPLSAPSVAREVLHHRDISVRGYKRADGMFDIEGHLHDTKAIDYAVASGRRRAGEALHSMWLRITVDRSFMIVDAEASSDAMPYVGFCDRITPDYKKLIGLRLTSGFTLRAKELLGGTRGCTHISDLVGIVATTAFQTAAGQGMQPPGVRPFQLDQCHALAVTAPAVARFYPEWYRGDTPDAQRSTIPENH